MQARLYLVSANKVSESKFRQLATALEASAPCAALTIRLENSGDGLWAALDQLTQKGADRIELRPIGLPFSQSLETWLPGAAGSWLAQHEGDAPDLFMAQSPQADRDAIASMATANVALRPIQAKPNGELGKGWDQPPDFRHHLLVCTGPRCHVKNAPNLALALKAELGKARMTADCLVTTTGCVFPCNAGPVIVHYPHGNWYRISDLADLRTFVAQALRQGDIPQHLLIHQTGGLKAPV